MIQSVLLLVSLALQVWGPLPSIDVANLLKPPPAVRPSPPPTGERPAKYATSLAQLQSDLTSISGKDELTVLILGDSHSTGYFGRELHRLFRKKVGAKVVMVSACGRAEAGHIDGTYAHCGVIIRDENNRSVVPKGCRKNPCLESDGDECSKRDCRPPKVESILKDLQPDITLVQLGGNNVWRGNRKKGWPKAERRMHELADIILRHGSRCMWVTPPDSAIRHDRLEDAFSAMYQEQLKDKCFVFNSRPHERPYLNYSAMLEGLQLHEEDHDGLHYGWLGDWGRKAQRQWAKEIVVDLMLHSIQVAEDKQQSSFQFPAKD